ncbi:MAG: hypothetical protein Q8O10_01535 [candidate division Zixibacteria bacterium]|jgi:hypothetical protein|nr:hypothetical protein [candidate division Zixibacteria bacterium]
MFGTKPVDPYEDARRYLDAGLVIVGQVLSCTTTVTEEREIPGDSGWVNHQDKLMKTYTIRVDSVLKGSIPDSTIIIQSESFNTWRSRLFNIGEKGDSLFLGQDFLSIDESDAVVPESGKFILLLKEVDGIYTSILCRAYDKFNLDFLKEVKEKGEDYFKPPKPLGE